MKKSFLTTLIILVIVTACLQHKEEPKLKIGVLLPLSGDLAVTGEKIDKGMRIAEAPDSVELIFEDTGSSAASAVSAAQKLIDIDHVDVIIGPYSPDETLAIIPLAEERGITVFSLSYCSDSFKQHKSLYCSYPTASSQLTTITPLEKKIRRIALVNQNSDFGINSRHAMRNRAAAAGYAIVLDELVAADEKDYRTVATKVKQSKADAVFSATDSPVYALSFMQQLSQAGFSGMRITFIDVDNKYLQQFGASVDGTYAPGIAPSRFSKQFADKYKAMYHEEPDYTSALGYDLLRYVTGMKTSSAFVYTNPAISQFKFLPDRTVSFDMELWQAKDSVYTRASE